MLATFKSLWATPLHGQHDKRYASGDQYQGAFIDGLRDGYGVYTTSSITYEGEWKKDKRHGQGKQDFKMVKRTKSGKDKVVSAGCYEGGWRLDKKHGVGRFVYSNGDDYHGEWLDGVKHGHGTYLFKRGDRFDGEFHNNEMHGKGVFLEHATQDQIIGRWQNDELDGRNLKICSDGTSFAVSYTNGELVGTQELGDDDPLLLQTGAARAIKCETVQRGAEERKEAHNDKVTSLVTDDML